MPAYKHLSKEKANSILKQADLSFAAESKHALDGIVVMGSKDSIDRMFREPEPERRALLDTLAELSQPEALDLVGIMYVGRGDYIDDESDRQQVLEALQAQLDAFRAQGAEDLVSICAEKDLVFHEYLRKGLELLS